MKDYSKLHKSYEYDKELATLLAEAMTELVEIEKRKQYLETLLKDNKKLKPFLWQTAGGAVIALHDLDQDHFENILRHITESGRSISPQMKAEAQTRNTPLPNEVRYLESGFNEFAFEDEDELA